MSAGTLRIRFDSRSVFLSGSLPVEIRDRHHKLVEELRGARTVELPEGLYSVSAVLENGARDTRVADVRAGMRVDITFTRILVTPPSDRGVIRTAWATRSAEEIRDFARGKRALSDFVKEDETGPESADSPRISLSDGLALEQVEQVRGTFSYSLRASSRGARLRWIALRARDEVVRLAVPLSTEAPEARRCIVTATHRKRADLDVKVSLAPERRVFAAVHAMLTSGQVGPAVDLARDATQLLASKYYDPIAAAYGGLTLERFRTLNANQAWVRNLARDFPWLPDGKILLSALLTRSSAVAERDEALDLLLVALSELPVFSEALSLGYTLLKRWPGHKRSSERRTVIARLVPIMAHLDHGSAFTLVRSSASNSHPWGGP